MSTTPRPLPAIYRWLVLVVTSLVCFAQYFIYDSITPLGTSIKEQLGFSGADYGLLFSFYSVANVLLLLVIVSGVLVDRLGIRTSGLLYGFLCVVGAALTAIGATPGFEEWLGPLASGLRGLPPADWSPALKLMLLGRMVYGVGAEAILVVNNKILARWFTGKELAFAFGANLTLMRLGTFLALNLQAPIAQRSSLSGALWFATALMAAGAASFFIYLALERSARGRPGAPTAAATATAEERFVLSEAFRFDSSFWLIALLCVSFYSAVFPFQAYAPDILVQKFGYSVTGAGHATSLLIFGTMIFTPLLGWLIDRFGRRATLMILGSLLLVPSHVLLGYTHITPVIPVFAVGVALSLVPAALWAAIPLLVPESRLGTAFGVVGYVQNVGLMLFPWLAGKIADAHTTPGPTGEPVVDYTSTMLLFVVLGLIGFAAAIALKWTDARRTDGQSIERILRQ